MGSLVMTVLVPDLLVTMSLVFAWRGAREVRAALRDIDAEAAPFRLVRGGRGLIVAVALTCIAAGLHFDSTGALWFGVVFLLEELYECGMVLAVLEWGRGHA